MKKEKEQTNIALFRLPHNILTNLCRIPMKIKLTEFIKITVHIGILSSQIKSSLINRCINLIFQ